MKTARCSPPCPARSPWPSPSRFNRPTRQRPGTGSFQIPVCTVRPFHSMSRGSPTFTDNSRAMSLRLGGNGPPPLAAAMASPPSGARSWLFTGEHFGDGELAIGAVRNHRLTRLKAQLGPVELYRHNVRLERY